MLSIIVPYRGRHLHLREFKFTVPVYLEYVYKQPFEIIVVEQYSWTKEFNRALLLNIGAKYADPSSVCFCMHDVDHIPKKVNYAPTEGIAQLVRSDVQLHDYLGGVTLIGKETFLALDGYSNRFWGWGGEDNELFFRAKSAGIAIEERYGLFQKLPHKKSGVYKPERMHQAMQPRSPFDGYSKMKFQLHTMWKEPVFHLTYIRALV